VLAEGFVVEGQLVERGGIERETLFELCAPPPQFLNRDAVVGGWRGSIGTRGGRAERVIREALSIVDLTPESRSGCGGRQGV
jgi:hypothetical protein